MLLQAHAQVETPKAARYLKALCNHFSHKVTAEHTENLGHVHFGIGICDMDVSDSTLSLHVQADSAENFARVKAVVADHLTRFSGDEALAVVWKDQEGTIR